MSLSSFSVFSDKILIKTMDFSSTIRRIFGFQSQPKPIPIKADLTQTRRCNLASIYRNPTPSGLPTYPGLEGSLNRIEELRKRDLSSCQDQTPLKQLRATWTRVSSGAVKRTYPDLVEVDLETNEDIIELEPPSKRNRMDSKPSQNGSVFNDAKDVEIVKIVKGSKSLKKMFPVINFPKFGLNPWRKKSILMKEDQNEEKKLYSALLKSQVYSAINSSRNKRLEVSHKPLIISEQSISLVADITSQNLTSFSPRSFRMVSEARRAHEKRAPKAPEVVTLDDEEEKKETNVVAKRVQVDRRHSLTPVTQATEKTDVKKPLERRPSSKFLDKCTTVLDPDFVPNLRRTCEKSRKEWQEQAENEAKKAELCAQITLSQRKKKEEKSLEVMTQRMKDYMKVTESLPSEEEVEIIPPLPELTSEMEREISAALGRGNPSEVLVEKFNLRIQRRDIQTLSGLNWLNDEVINFYMNLLMDRGKLDNYPSVYAFNTFFYPKLVSGGHSALKRWTKKVDIFAHDYVVAPVHLGVHWCMSIIDMKKKTVMYFDSMGGRNDQCLTALKQYLIDEMMDKKKEKLDISEWKFVFMKNIPQQENGSDCGMFSCMYAEYTCRNASISFTQENMPYFRRKMIYEILKCKLLC